MFKLLIVRTSLPGAELRHGGQWLEGSVPHGRDDQQQLQEDANGFPRGFWITET
jgi:hypothetical protein